MKNIKLIILIGFITVMTLFVWKYKNTTQSVNTRTSITPSVTQTSPVPCQVCGPQGIHNIEGNLCPEGYVCKQGQTTTVSYCVRPEESVGICESAQTDEY